MKLLLVDDHVAMRRLIGRVVSEMVSGDNEESNSEVVEVVFGAGVRVVTLGKFFWRVVEGRVTFEQEEKLLPIVQ